MNFKEFFLENMGNVGSLSNAHHHRNLTKMKDGGIHGDGKIKSLKTVATYRTKEYFKNKKLEDAKNGKKRWISNNEALKLANQHGLNLKNLTGKGLRLNSKHNASLYYCLIKKRYYLS
jgi:hypothetical protein